MNGNRFSISVTWDWRPESPAEIGVKFLRTLDALSVINPNFRVWRVADDEREKFFPLESVRETILTIVEHGVSRGDDDQPEPEMGYHISAQNGDGEAEQYPFLVNFSVRTGGVPNTSRCASLSTAYNLIPDRSIVAYPVFKSALMTLIRIWGASSARVFSYELTRDWDDPSFKFDLNWMTYLSTPLAKQITPPPGVTVEKMQDGGLLLIAAEETFDTGNPGHMAAARRMRDAMAPINDLEQHERDKQRSIETMQILKAMGFPGERVSNRRVPRS